MKALQKTTTIPLLVMALILIVQAASSQSPALTPSAPSSPSSVDYMHMKSPVVEQASAASSASAPSKKQLSAMSTRQLMEMYSRTAPTTSK